MDKTYLVSEGLISKTKFFDAKSELSTLAPSVLDNEAVIVTKNGSYYGLVDSNAIYNYVQRLKFDKRRAAETVATRAPRITENTSINDAMQYFYRTKASALPYLKGDRVVGILKRATVLKVLLSSHAIKDATVGETMTAPLISIDGNDSLLEAKAKMKQFNVNRLAVTEGGMLEGVVNKYDIIKRFLRPVERLPRIKFSKEGIAQPRIKDAILAPPAQIEQAKTLSDAAREMIEGNVSSLVVTDKGRPVGMVTEFDVILSSMAHANEANRIFVSGLDAGTYQYEDEVRELLNAFVAQMERMHAIRINFLSIVVKALRSNAYEIAARLSLGGRRGTINAQISGHMFDRTVEQLLSTLKTEIRKRKEMVVTKRRLREPSAAQPEEELE